MQLTQAIHLTFPRTEIGTDSGQMRLNVSSYGGIMVKRFNIILCIIILLVLATATSSAASENEISHLSGVLKKTLKDPTCAYYLEIDGSLNRMRLRGELLEKFDIGTRIHVEGKLQTKYYNNENSDNISPFPPKRWDIYMEIFEVKAITKPFEIADEIVKSKQQLTFKETLSKKSIPIIGMWNDGWVGENIGIYIENNGTGDIISLKCEAITWEFDSDTNVLIIKYIHQQNKQEISQEFKYIPKENVLFTESFYGPKNNKHVFHRQSELEIERWKKIKSENILR